MNPPFAPSPIVPILSPVSAQFEPQEPTIFDGNARYSAVSALGECSRSRISGTRSAVSLPDDRAPPPLGQHQTLSLPPAQYPESLRTANLKTFQWSRLLLAGQQERRLQTSSSVTPHLSASQTGTSSTSTAQSSLLSAMSVESLPHYTVPNAAEDILEDPTTAHSVRPGMSEAMNAMSQLSSMPWRMAHMRLEPISPASPNDRREEQHRSPPLRLQTSPEAPRENERVDSPSPMMSIEMSNGRRKLSLSSPRDRMDSSPLLHRRPVTGYNRAGIFHGPVSRENSGFANPTVEAADERWRRAETSDTPFSPFSPTEAPLTAKPSFTQQDDGDVSEPSSANSLTRSDDPRKAPTQTKITEFFPSTAAPASTPPHKPGLSEPQNTLNSSPHMHFKGKNSAGVHSEWICRETSGFANPTSAASRERWNTSDERESKGRWNGLPRVNSWEMTKTHVFGTTNCFDPIGNGFGISGKMEGAAISSGASQSDIASKSTRAPPAMGLELGSYNTQTQDIPRVNPPANATMPPVAAGSSDETPTAILPLPSSQYSGGIGNYGPVPSGLIAAATKAQHNRKSSTDRKRQTLEAGKQISHTPGCPCSQRQAVRDNAVEILSSGEAWNWCGPCRTPAGGLARYLEEAWAAIKNGEPEPSEPGERKEAYVAMVEAWESWKVKKRLPPPPLSMRSVLSSGNCMDLRLMAFGGPYNAKAELVFIDPVLYAAQLKEKQRLKEAGGLQDVEVGNSSSPSKWRGNMLSTRYYEAPNLDPDGLLTAIPGKEPKDFKAAWAEYKKSRDGMSLPREERSKSTGSASGLGLETLDINAANESRLRAEWGESDKQKKRQRALEMARLELEQAKEEQAEKEARIKGTHLPLRTTKGNALGLRFSQARNSGFGERSGVRSPDRHELRAEQFEVQQGDEDEIEANEHLIKQEADFEDRELQKSQQDSGECDRLRWTKNSGFELGDRGIRDQRGSLKPSAEYYLKLGSAARNMNKAISPIVDAAGFEEDMSTAWLMTSPLSALGTPGSAELRKDGEGEEGKECFGVSTHATPRSGTPRSGRKLGRRSKQEAEDELALVNISPIELLPGQEEGEGDDRLLKWTGEIISRLGKGVAQEITTDTPPPPARLVQLPSQGMRSAAEERRHRRRMERKQSGSAASTPAPSTELMQQEWTKTTTPKV